MGYTHYWRYAPTKLRGWKAAIGDCDRIVGTVAAQYDLDLSENGKADLWFNGRGDNAHEDFVIPRTIGGVKDELALRREQFAKICRNKEELDSQARFAFCKTAQKPYDIVVVACLCVLSETGLEISSDGNASEWAAGHALAQEILGRAVGNPIKEEAA